MSKQTKSASGHITVKELAKWLSELPPEWQDKEVKSVVGGMPHTLKRIVALKEKSDGYMCVAANPMGTHLPFDETYEWVEVIS